MTPRDRWMLIALAAVWGLNFTAIGIALQGIAPLLLAAIRFTLVAIPAVFVLSRPSVPLLHIAWYGLAMFAVQFALLFSGMALGVSPGVASLVLQAQVFATMGLALWFGHERSHPHQRWGVLLGAIGLGAIAFERQPGAPALGLLLVLLAALSWGVGNTLSRRLLAGQAVLPLVAWGSLFSVPPIALASLWIEGLDSWLLAWQRSGLAQVLAVVYIVYPTTLLGFAVWAHQLRRHAASAVAPYTMLVPIFGLGFAALLVNEALSAVKLGAVVLVLVGVAISQFGAAIAFPGRKKGSEG